MTTDRQAPHGLTIRADLPTAVQRYDRRMDDQRFAQGGLIPGPPIRMKASDFFQYVGEHVVHADGSMKRWTGEQLVPCTGCSYPDHRIGAAAWSKAQRLVESRRS